MPDHNPALNMPPINSQLVSDVSENAMSREKSKMWFFIK